MSSCEKGRLINVKYSCHKCSTSFYQQVVECSISLCQQVVQWPGTPFYQQSLWWGTLQCHLAVCCSTPRRCLSRWAVLTNTSQLLLQLKLRISNKLKKERKKKQRKKKRWSRFEPFVSFEGVVYYIPTFLGFPHQALSKLTNKRVHLYIYIYIYIYKLIGENIGHKNTLSKPNDSLRTPKTTSILQIVWKTRILLRVPSLDSLPPPPPPPAPLVLSASTPRGAAFSSSRSFASHFAPSEQGAGVDWLCMLPNCQSINTAEVSSRQSSRINRAVPSVQSRQHQGKGEGDVCVCVLGVGGGWGGGGVIAWLKNFTLRELQQPSTS